jgi:mono/diheme cytochrome c family protein
MKTKIIAIVLLGTLIYSCSPKVIQTEAPKVDEVPLTPELAEGKVLYENNCANCHKLYDPNKFSAEQWTPIVLRMQKKAKISDEEREKIYAYLTK